MGILAVYAQMGYSGAMDIGILGILSACVGAAFCFIIAGAVWMERPGESSAEEMMALFDIDAEKV